MQAVAELTSQQAHITLQVPGPGPPHFKLHIKLKQPVQPGNRCGQCISRAGDAPGLQIAPGSVTQVRGCYMGMLCTRAAQLVVLVPLKCTCLMRLVERYVPDSMSA